MTAHLEDVAADLRRQVAALEQRLQASLAERDEAIAEQAATAEVLQVINSSPGDLAPVFDAITERAMRLCGAAFGGMWLVEGDNVRAAGKGSNLPKAYLEFLMRERVPLTQVFGRAAHDRPFLQIPDVSATGAYRDRLPVTVASVELGGVRTILCVPLRERGSIVGIINLYRQEVRPFSDKQIALVQSFAVQAQIAMKNARLLTETKEALERQTATSEILRVISQSPTDARPVFESIVLTAVRLLRCDLVFVLLRDGSTFGPAAVASPEGPLADVGPTNLPIDPNHNFPSRAIIDKKKLHLPDWSLIDLPEHERNIRTIFGVNSALYLPLLHEGECIGLLTLVGKRPNSFGPGEIAQAESFRDQALIAIQNARLFNETREALERQTGTAEILKVIASSPSDVQPVFDAIATSANRLLGGFSTAVWRFEGDTGHLASFTPTNPEADAALQALSPLPIKDLAVFALLNEGEIAQLADTEEGPPRLRDLARLRGYRAMLFVPLIYQGAPIGFVSVTRRAPGAFAHGDVQLLKTFADQAVIGIQNARLFNETREALQQQTATAEVLKVISRSTFDLDAVLTTLTDSARTLCGAANATVHMRDGDAMRLRAQTGCTPEFVAYLHDTPIHPNRKRGERTHIGRAALTAATVEIPDVLDAPDFLLGDAPSLGNFRAVLGVPLLREGRVEGVFSLARPEPGPFTPRQSELVRAFADQAVIAIENVRLFDEVQARTRDLSEALQQQTATADVLKVISRSVFDLQAVLDTLVGSARELCGAEAGLLYLRGDDAFECKAIAGAGVAEANLLFKGRPIRAGRGTAAERVILSGEVESVTDLFEDPEFDPRLKAAMQSAAAIGSGISDIRSVLAVPMKRDDAVVGVVAIARSQAGPFPPRQIELLQTFADQAVIAIENARLFDEVQARTKDLTEALQQQTATADVLKVISRSAFDLQTVFNTLLGSAVALSGADSGVLCVRDGDAFRCKSFVNKSPDLVRILAENPITPGPGSVMGRVALSGRIEWIEDTLEDSVLSMRDVIRRTNDDRALVGVPLLREARIEGAIVLGRSEPGRFSARSIELTQTFADQAVIAIENVRLFEQVQARTRDLEESLAQQTATADVLKVISRSVFDLNPVLQTLIDTAVRLTRGSRGTIWIRKGDVLVASAFHQNVSSELRAYLSSAPRSLNEEDYLARAARDKTVVHISDLSTHQDPFTAGIRQRVAFGAGLWVPLIRDGETIGVFGVPRDEAIAFTDREIEIVKTFADQAVIAIENVRLFDEVQARTRDLAEALQQQTATAEVLKVISRSAFDLQAVFDTLISSAVELSGAFSGTICVRDGHVFRYRSSAGAGASPALHKYLEDHPATPGRGTVAGRVLLSGKVERIPDLLEDLEYVVPVNAYGNAARALLGVPLLRNDGVEGALLLTRREPGHFTDRQIEIVQTFADQAVIAIENVRLFDEVQARTKELATSLDDLRAAQDRLIQSEKLASLGQLTAGIAHEIKNPLNFINNFSGLSRELLGELGDALKSAPLEKSLREEADELIAMVGANLDKVVQHGKRADSIVKNMLLHSREGSGERMTVNVNAMVEEALNLAYHGARAEKPGFNVTIAKSLDPQAGAADLHAQELTRVLLNLISNGFYATTKRKQGEANGDYEPTITASTRDLGDRVEIAIRDNGTGIPEEVKAKMFNPFFTTKPAGEGTGLGLSLSHDIVVKQHGGTIEVATESGAYTQFTIQLPRAAQGAPVKPGAVH